MEGSQYILHCQKDSYAQQASATVLKCTEAQTGTWEVILTDTVIFPEGGGQPWDQGTIDDAEVSSCIRKDGCAVHITNKPLEVGKEVKVIVDWNRRWDHMQQHSGQHLITALASNLFGWKTVSWNLGAERSSIDLACSQISQNDMEKLEAELNKSILARSPVTYALFTRDSPELQKVYSRGIPDDVTGEVRVVSIGGIDQNTCCGTHVKDTGDLQYIKLLYSEKFKANTKLWFVAGSRVGKNLATLINFERQLQAKLQSPPTNFLEKVDELQGKLKTTTQYSKDLVQELAIVKAHELRAQVQKGDLKFIAHHRSDGTPDYTGPFLIAISGQEPVKKGKQPALTLPCAVLLTTGEETCNEGGHIFFGAEESMVANAEKIFSELLQAKGRANKGEYRGKAASMANLKKAQDEIEKLVTKT